MWPALRVESLKICSTLITETSFILRILINLWPLNFVFISCTNSITFKCIFTKCIFYLFQFQVESEDRKRRLYFNAIGRDDNMTITVEGGGVNASFVQADIGALNGVVHIIDRVLGIPSSTVAEKLAIDPIMRYFTFYCRMLFDMSALPVRIYYVLDHVCL